MQSAKKWNPRDLHKPLFNFVGEILLRLWFFLCQVLWAANVRCKKENWKQKEGEELWGESVITSMLLWLYRKLHVTFPVKVPSPANRETLFGIFPTNIQFFIASADTHCIHPHQPSFTLVLHQKWILLFYLFSLVWGRGGGKMWKQIFYCAVSVGCLKLWKVCCSGMRRKQKLLFQHQKLLI